MAISIAPAFRPFIYPDSAARAFCYLWEYTHALRALYETPALAVGAESLAAQAEAGRDHQRCSNPVGRC